MASEKIKPKPDESIGYTIVFNMPVIARVHKSMTNIGFAYSMPESRCFEFNVHTGCDFILAQKAGNWQEKNEKRAGSLKNQLQKVIV